MRVLMHWLDAVHPARSIHLSLNSPIQDALQRVLWAHKDPLWAVQHPGPPPFQQDCFVFKEHLLGCKDVGAPEAVVQAVASVPL